MHAFSEYINSVLSGPGPDGKGGVAGLPLDPKTDDLFKVVSEGVLLCRCVNVCLWRERGGGREGRRDGGRGRGGERAEGCVRGVGTWRALAQIAY